LLHPTSARSTCASQADEDSAVTGAAAAAAAFDRLVATSASMQRVRRTLEKVAPTRATVLLLGESGTGKELLARELHALSRRPARTWVAINCAAIPESLLESELFGYERGAFTGALRRTRGKIETADGGTLFLDEIGDMALPLQCKLLRFLQERVIERVGGREPIPVDVRIIAATNRNLQAAIAQKTFRDDLYYRLSEVTIAIPPLRERESDAVLIASDLLRRTRRGRQAARFAPDAIAAIESHTWPGNVRELENRVKRAVILAEGALITAGDLGLATDRADWSDVPTLRETRRRAENQAVQRALALTGGNFSQAAKLLDVTRQVLYDIVSRMGGSEGGE
jgi:two-component system, NtrC family, response regulator